MSRLGVTPRRIVLAEILLLSLVLSTFLGFAVKIYHAPYLPSSEINDGFGYFMGAKSFYLNHQLRGPLLHLNMASLIGEFYCHGFAYSLINGSAALLVGWHDKLIIDVNIVLLATAVLFILTRHYAWPWKLAFVLVFLTYFLTPTMTFAYMQEIVHLLLALVIGHLLFTIIDREDRGRQWGLVMCYYILIAAAAAIRPPWVLWAVGGFAIVRSRRDLVVFGFLAFAYLGLGYLFFKLFYAPYPYFSPYAATFAALSEHRIIDALFAVFKPLSENFAKLFSGDFYIFGKTHIPNAYTLFIIAVTAYLYYLYRSFGDRHALAVALVATTYIFVIFVVWDVLSGARQIAAVFVLQLIYLVRSKKTALMVTLVVAQLAIFPAVVRITNQVVRVQASAGEYAVQNRAQLRMVDGLSSAVKIGRPATIYVDNTLSNTHYPVTIHLPLRSADGYALRYSQDIGATQPMSQRVFDRQFLDFVLSKVPVTRPDLTLVYESHDLQLYRLE